MNDEHTDRWTELQVSPNGVSCTVYEQHGDDPITAVDETWFTWSEMEEHRSERTTIILGDNDD